MPLNQEELAPYAEMLGVSPEALTPDNFRDAMAKVVNASKAAAAEAETAGVQLSQVRTDLESEKVRRENAERLAGEREVLLSQNPKPRSVDPEVLKDRADVYTQRIDVMVDKGDMPQFIADKLKAKINLNGGPNAVMLSQSPSDNVRPIDFDLSLFDGSKLGIQAGGEVLLHAQRVNVPTGDPAKDGAKPEDVADARTAYGLPAKTA